MVSMVLFSSETSFFSDLMTSRLFSSRNKMIRKKAKQTIKYLFLTIFQNTVSLNFFFMDECLKGSKGYGIASLYSKTLAYTYHVVFHVVHLFEFRHGDAV